MNAASSPRLRIAVPAAGFSRRLGKSKALVRVRHSSLLRRTVALLATLTRSRIVVIAPPKASRFRVELRGLQALIVPNAARGQGLSSSVRLALREGRHGNALMLVPVDLPGLKRRELVRLIARWRATPRRVVGRRVGGRARVPLILPKWLFAAAQNINGDTGLRAFVDALPAGEAALVDMPSAAADVDTPAELARARRRLYNAASTSPSRLSGLSVGA
jgi:CTP:molybdopterin cytidylyltransferase MocA